MGEKVIQKKELLFHIDMSRPVAAYNPEVSEQEQQVFFSDLYQTVNTSNFFAVIIVVNSKRLYAIIHSGNFC